MQPIQPNARVTFRIAHEDDAVLVVEKMPRVVSMPGLGHEHDTLLNGLFATHASQLSRLGKDRSYGLMHRLDAQTSGLMIVALTQDAYDSLYEQFKQRTIGKYYWALSFKAPREPKGVIRFPIEEFQNRVSRWSTMKQARISKSGAASLTAYRVIEANEIAALIEARPVTGRLHQVRVHLDAIGCGILGDQIYGPRATSEAAPRLALHAHRIQFDHPTTGDRLDLSCGWPSDLRKVLNRLSLRRPDLAPRSKDAGHQPTGEAVSEENPTLSQDES